MTRRKSNPLLRLLGWLGLAVVTVLNLLPIIWGLVTSTKSAGRIFSTDTLLWGFSPTLDNYQNVLQGSFGGAFIVSLLYALGATIAALVLASLAAYALDRFHFPFRNAIFYVIVGCVPLAIGAAVLVVPNYLYFSAIGFTNQWFTLPLLYVGLNLPIAIWVLKGSIEAVPASLDDAGKLDGLNSMGVLLRVILPLCRPGLFAAGMLVFIGAWSEFVAGSVFVQDAALRPVQVAIYQYISAYGRQWGSLTASALLAVLPILVLVVVFGKQLVSGLTQGSVKG